MKVDTSLIKELRELTGAGMMDCKNALEENNCDVQLACDWLRKKGIAKAAKKAGRIAAEGMSTALVKGDEAIIIEVNSETDFAAKSDNFKLLVNTVADMILTSKPATVEEAVSLTNDVFTNATLKIGEKLSLRRFNILTKTPEQHFGTQVHLGGKIATLVVVEGGDASLAAHLATHITSLDTSFRTTSDIPSDVLEHETELQMELSKQDPSLASKPANILQNIIKGRVSKHFAEVVLYEQDYLYEPGTKVGAYLKNHKADVVAFARYSTGEGMEKRVENFAEEVQKQMQ